jgi:ribosomal-protein-alanine N-acetyltransferase
MADQSAPAQTSIAAPESLKLLGVTFAHCALIARLHGLCFEEGWNSATVAQVLRLAGAFGLLATVPERTPDGRLVGPDAQTPIGFALTAGVLDERELLSLGVVPAHRRQGAASALIDAVVERVQGEGVKRLLLEVAEDNDEAQRLYARFGFEPIGRRPGYYAKRNGPSVAAITLARAI